MKDVRMRIYIILTAILILFSTRGILPAEEEKMQEELKAFRVTLYSEQERIPLEGLLTLEGTLYDINALKGN
jgi:hypothetical protein